MDVLTSISKNGGLLFDVNLLMLSFFAPRKARTMDFLLNIRLLIFGWKSCEGENKFLFLSLLQDVEVILTS